MQTLDQETKLENLKKQIHLSNCIDILMKQTLKLMDMVNSNQQEVNDLKAEQDHYAHIAQMGSSVVEEHSKDDDDIDLDDYDILPSVF